MEDYFLGVDVGSSKTHALIADGEGHILALGRAGGGNPDVVGYAELRHVVSRAVHQALEAASLSVGHLRAAGFGVAGYDWPSQREGLLSVLKETLQQELPMEAVNDAVLGLLASPRGWGISLVSGTGCNCWGRSPQGEYAHMTGYGALMGEYAGATELVERAVHCVAYEWTGRGQPTALSRVFIQKVKAKGLEDLIEGLCRGYYTLGPEAAPLVFECAAQGDKVALDLLAWAGSELGAMVKTIARRLRIMHLAPDIILIGSLFRGHPSLQKWVEEAVLPEIPGARFVPMQTLPVIGAVVLAMEQLHWPRERIRQALERMHSQAAVWQEGER